MTRQSATLKEVARLAGVSYQTVSKVLNQQAQVSPDTKARILEAVQQLDYRPSQLGRSLRSQRSRLIGYSWAPSNPDQPNPILDQFLQSMAQAADQAGYHLLCFPNSRSQLQNLETYRDLIATRRVDGFVLSSVEFNDPCVRLLQELGYPFVAFGRSNPDWRFPCVDVDGGDGMRQATEYLLQLGHRRIFALAWPETSRVGSNRLEGYLQALEQHGIQPEEGWISRVEGNVDFGYQVAARWLDLPPAQRPTAIASLNDSMAIGAMRAARQAGLQVGVDLAVTGFDDTPLIQFLNPPLTSVRQPVWEVGQRIISMLLDILEGQPVPLDPVLFQPQLICRESTGGSLLRP